MTNQTRRQLTLFPDPKDAMSIEAIRAKYNPLQKELIDCHVTLCREDEIVNLDKVLHNLNYLRQGPISIGFGGVVRFDDDKGVLMPAAGNNEQFHTVRHQVLKGVNSHPKKHEPHITLIHPRNGTCTDSIFESIAQAHLPTTLSFKTISLIEQTGGGKWKTLKTFDLVE